jgi:hypothetical protein
LSILVKWKADFKLSTKHNTYESALTPLEKAIALEWEQGVKKLLESGANANIVGRQNSYTLLPPTAGISIMKLLQRYGADISASDNYGGTALRHFSSLNSVVGVKFLFDNGAHPNCPIDLPNGTTLQMACSMFYPWKNSVEMAGLWGKCEYSLKQF